MKTKKIKITVTFIMSFLAFLLAVCSFGLFQRAKQATASAAESKYGALIQEFQIASDTHVHRTGDTNASTINGRVQNFFNQVMGVSPTTSGVFINGDIVDGNWDYSSKTLSAQYENLHTLATGAGLDKSKIYTVSGNHAYHAYEGDANRDQVCINEFLTGTKGLGNDQGIHDGEADGDGSTNNNMYYYVDVGGSRFIMLSSLHVEGRSDVAYLGDTQLAWFSSALASAPQGRPIYVLLHQGLKDTSAGTAGETAIDPTEETYLRGELAKYSRAILFSGHSHAALGATSFYQGGGITTVNTSTVGWENNEAYFVYEYERAVVLKGRNITNGTWISEAEFVFNYHTFDHVEAKQAKSNTESGNIEYWHCTDCDKYFSNAGETTYENTIVKYTYGNTAMNALNKNNFYINGAELRYDSDEYSKAMRYHVTIEKSVYETLTQAGQVETGVVLFPYKKLDGNPLTVNLQSVTQGVMRTAWTQGTDTPSTELQNSFFVYNVPNVNNGTDIAVVAYVKLGGEYYYSELYSCSMSYVASEAIKAGKTTDVQGNSLRENYLTVVQTVDAGNGSVKTHSCYYGDSLVEPDDPTRDGYHFEGWKMDGVAVDFATETLKGDCTLVAEWTPIEYALTFTGDGNLPSATTYNVENAAEYVLPVPTHPTAGYQFDGWYDGATKVTTLAGRTGALTLSAQWIDRSRELDTANAVGFEIAGGVYTAPASKTSHVYTFGNGKAFVATVDITATKNAGDSGMGFSVKDGDGNVLNFMFVNWAASTVCLQYGYGYGAYGVGRYNGGSTYYNFSGYVNNVTINVSIAYDGNSFTLYENGLYRTRFTLADINANLSNATGKFTENEELTVGLFGFNGTNTGGKFENFTVNYYTATEFATVPTADLEIYKETELIETVKNVAIVTGARIFKLNADVREFEGTEYQVDASSSTLTATLGTTKTVFKIVYQPVLNPVYNFSASGANYEYLVSGTSVYLEADATVGTDGQRFNGFVLSQGEKTATTKKLSFVFNQKSVMVQKAYTWCNDGYRYTGRTDAEDVVYMDAIEEATGSRTGIIASDNILKSASATKIKIELTNGQVKVYAGGTLYVTVDLATLNTGLSLGFDMSASFDVGLYGYDCNTGGQDVTFENVSYGDIV